MCGSTTPILAREPAARSRCIPPAAGSSRALNPFQSQETVSPVKHSWETSALPTPSIKGLSRPLKPLAPSGRCITNQGSVPATPDTPMTISWRRLHRDHGREHFIAALAFGTIPSPKGRSCPCGTLARTLRGLWTPDQHSRGVGCTSCHGGTFCGTNHAPVDGRLSFDHRRHSVSCLMDAADQHHVANSA